MKSDWRLVGCRPNLVGPRAYWWGGAPQFGGARLPEDRRFYQGNRRTLTNPPGYIEKRAEP